MKEAVFALPEFKKDGIYSFDLTAVDKAGNKSVLCRNTSVLMMNSDVLAYITESKKADNVKDSTGWYSLQKDEKTPISKRPDDFKDLKSQCSLLQIPKPISYYETKMAKQMILV